MPLGKVENSKVLHKQYYVFRDQCIRLVNYINTYEALFDSDTSNLAILQDTAELFFYDINELLIDRIWLEVYKVTENSTENKNLSTVYFVDQILKIHGLETERFKTIRGLSDKLRKTSKKLKPARNQYLTHLDKALATDKQLIKKLSKEEFYVFR